MPSGPLRQRAPPARQMGVMPCFFMLSTCASGMTATLPFLVLTDVFLMCDCTSAPCSESTRRTLSSRDAARSNLEGSLTVAVHEPSGFSLYEADRPNSRFTSPNVGERVTLLCLAASDSRTV